VKYRRVEARGFKQTRRATITFWQNCFV